MTRLDAAKRFKWVIELAHTTEKLAAIREQATTAFTTETVVSTVVDRDAAVVRAPSEFSIVAAKPVQSVSCFVSMDRFSRSVVQMGEFAAESSFSPEPCLELGHTTQIPLVFRPQIVSGFCRENKRFPFRSAGSEKTRLPDLRLQQWHGWLGCVCGAFRGLTRHIGHRESHAAKSQNWRLNFARFVVSTKLSPCCRVFHGF